MNNYVFFGTPRFAAIVLDTLIKGGYVPSLVVCNPDRPTGRKKILTPPPTKIIAQQYGIPVWQPEKLEIGNWKLEIQKRGTIDFAIVAAYNKIISKEILETLPDKFLGVHPSLLPQYRGPSPIQTSILEGEKTTGVTLFLTDEKVDHGPILAQEELEFPISVPSGHLPQGDNFPTLTEKLAELAGALLLQTLPKLIQEKIHPVPQDHELATFTKKFTTDDAFVNPAELQSAITGENEFLAVKIERMMRALNPEPGVWTYGAIKGTLVLPGGEKRLKLLHGKMSGASLLLQEVQQEGRVPVQLF